jgi:hypothetical protein
LSKSIEFPLIMLLWVIIGVVVAINNGYDEMHNASEIATFVLAVILWPIPAFGGRVGIRF